MLKHISILFIFLFAVSQRSVAQIGCSTLGQNPETAFPVCASQPFPQSSVPECGGRIVYAPGCNADTLRDENPYWYKFTCFNGGSLGFRITPVDANDDYDWQLFDVTNHAPSDVYTDRSLFVACNWSGEHGTTGASNAGNSLIVCATTNRSPYRPLFSSMPNLITGHNYLLLISHFLGSAQSGYQLAFTGGNAVITDPFDPHLSSAAASCDATKVKITLNKKIKCNSLAFDGSDFSIDAPGITILSATGNGCSNSFDMDQVTLSLSGPLAPGNYTITVKKGTDNNTLVDNCDRLIPENETLPLVIVPLQPTPMDSLTTPKCSPQTLTLVFKKQINCSSVAANGSDFIISGPYAVGIAGASGNCVDGLSSTITIQLTAPLQKAGNFILTLKQGTDGNTIVDECAQETPAGSFLPFVIKDTVNADFTYNITYACDQDIVNYYHNGNNTVNNWNWNFDNIRSSNLQNPAISYTNFEDKQTTLIVSNGVCSDTSFAIIKFNNLLHAKFEVTSLVCPGDKAFIKNNTIGKVIDAWNWNFGNGLTSNVKDPAPQIYDVRTNSYGALVTLIVTNDYGCKDSLSQIVSVIKNCYIAVPSAFTPNGDGLNDYLYPLNAYKAVNLNFSVYNRFGQLLFHTTDWTNKWDGRFKGQGADTGTYVWILTYTDRDTHRFINQKGTTVLIR